LLKIMDAYGVTEQERKEIFTVYSASAVWEKMAQIDQVANKTLRNDVVHQLYRRVKKKK